MAPIIYVTRDIERALGMEPAGSYFVVSNDTKYGRAVREKFPENVFLIDEKEQFDTYDLLTLPEVQEKVSRLQASVVVFQNTSRIERLAKEKGWNLLNPSAELAKKVEEKISQAKWLGEDARLLAPHKIFKLKNLDFNGKVVIQFNHSHTGHGTYILEKSETLSNLREKFPERECRVSDFIDGPVFTVNTVISGTKTLVGNPSYQITGLFPFTDLPFSTIGNDFALPRHAKYEKVLDETIKIAEKVGERLAKDGWKGFFGIDVIYDEKADRTYLLEINARQPASAVFESKLQKKAEPASPSIFEAHIAALSGDSSERKITKIGEGAQIVKRVTGKADDVQLDMLRKNGFEVIEYELSSHNKELFRIQSGKGIMKSHNVLNETGKIISSCIR